MTSIATKVIKSNRLHIDQPLLAASIGLLLLGYVMVTSSSMHMGASMHNILHYPLHQLAHIALGLIAAVLVARVPMAYWEKISQTLFLFGLLLLVIVLIPGVGVAVNGSVRWLSLMGLRIQVSEVVKLISVLYMAGYITRYQDNVRQSHYGSLKPLSLFLVACLLLLLEPDFGSSVVIMVIAMGMLLLGGARLLQFGVLAALLAVPVGLLVIWSPYRLARVTGFIDPWLHAKDSGYQLTQALIAFGRGEFAGVGLGNGLQKLFYLPEAHTDFLFSVLAEELGLLGVTSVIGLFAIFIWRGFIIGENAEQAKQPFAALVAYGLTIWFGFQSFVNMGVNMGILPTKGLTLPLMSYGGGSMIVMCVAVAVLFRVHYEVTEQIKSTVKGKVL